VIRVALTFRVSIEGANEVLRASDKLPKDADTELREQAFDIAKVLADRIKAAGRRHSRQAGRAASTVKEVKGRWPIVQASNTGRAKGLLFGSEFGMTRKSGWYGKRRYFDSRGSQFGPHLGGGSYWFFKTADGMQPYVAEQWREVADNVVRRWSA
jgi:hypothetical protein